MEYSYTIIIPHRNIPSLLERCLASIPQMEDLQVIVVDDGSEKTHLQGIRAMEKKYPSIEFYFSEQSGGGGAARNRGLEYAQGKYVLFADADDYYLPSFKAILEEYRDSDSDLIFLNAISLDSETGKPTSRVDHLQQMHAQYKKNSKKGIKELKYRFGEPWCKIISRDMIVRNQIRFEETPIHNDTKFSYLAGYYSKRAEANSTEVYCLVDRQSSVSKQRTAENRLLCTRIFSEKNRFLRENGVGYFDKMIYVSMYASLKQKKFSEFKTHLDIAKKYGIKSASILYGMGIDFIGRKIGGILSKLKNPSHEKL